MKQPFCRFRLALLLLVFLASGPAGADPADRNAGDVQKWGERMYRDGILPNGEPLKAVVKGDVPVEGTMFSCVTCHLRSGYGSREGQIRTPPIDGARLYSPILQVRGAPLFSRSSGTGEKLYRPAYTDETLGRVLETGIDPGARQLNDVMPIYFLSEKDRDILVRYLKHLSTNAPPGITDTEIRFATVVTADVPREERDGMLVPLQNYIRNWRLPKAMERGMRSSVFSREGVMRGLRKPVLSVWELTGPPGTWREQLERHYSREPVFALLGGISTGEWTPIHRFCEENRIPAIYPMTDLPVISETDWYTLYLSKGYYQEGEAAARFLHDRERATPRLSVVQVFRDEPSGRSLAQGFQRTWEALGHEPPRAVVLGRGKTSIADVWKSFRENAPNTVVSLWLDDSAFPDLGQLAKDHAAPSMIVSSASLLRDRLYRMPENERSYLYFTYPKALPARQAPRPAASPRRSAADTELKMHSLVQTVSGPLSQMRSFLSRENFLEMIESTVDLTASPSAYPRLSFGPGQRYASKGCYVVQLSDGPDPVLVRKSDWVIH